MKADRRSSLINRNTQTFFGRVIKREKLENLLATGMIQGKRRRKQQEKMLYGLTKGLNVG